MAAINPSAQVVDVEIGRRAPILQTGFTMIEVLISLLIIVLGLLGLAGLQTRMHQAEFESYQRSQALVLLYDMVDRIQAHRVSANCFRVITTDTAAGTPYVGVGGTLPAACGASFGADADLAISRWHDQLTGSAELKGGAAVGAVIGARGCVSYDAATELPGTVGTGIYTVTVAWQGTTDTVAPTIACANNLYGAESRRRVVSTTLRLADLK